MFVLETLQQLMDRARRSFRANLKGSDASVWPNNIYVTAKVIAGFCFELFGFANYIRRMIFVHTAPDMETLLMHGAEFGMPRRPAAPARGYVKLAASTAASVDAGAIFERTDGVQYRSLGATGIAGPGVMVVEVIAITDGAAGNAIAGTALTPVSGVLGTADITVDQGGIASGEDDEDFDSYQARIWFRKKNPPHGGAAADYVRWASEVSGVSIGYDGAPRVFVWRRWAGVGSVRVFVLMDALYPNGIAPAAEIARVADHIETVRPSGAIVTVSAPAPRPIDVTIAGLVPNTAAERETIEAELKAAIFRLGRVAGGEDERFRSSMPYLAFPETFSVSWIWQAVANASGEQRHSIQAPAADIVLNPGEIPVLGNVQFV